jgi:hypothetical protein
MATAKKPTKPIASAPPSAANLPAVKKEAPPPAIMDMEQYASAGLEQVNAARDLTIPRLTILQALSPQLNKVKPEYMKGAMAGQICDGAVQQTWDDAIEFVPVHYKVQWLEWAPRSSGKGLVAIHDNDDCMRDCTKDDRNRNVNVAGNLIVETAMFIGFNLSAGGRRCFISMTSTQRKKAKKWLDLAVSERIKNAQGIEFVPPLFYRSYTLSVIPESNNDGDWFGWKLERSKTLPELGALGQKIFSEAVILRESIQAGREKIDVNAMDDRSAAHSDSDEM